MDSYNYTNFPRDMDQADFDAFAQGPKVGGQAPDARLIDAFSGEAHSLAAQARQGPLLIEFGSFT